MTLDEAINIACSYTDSERDDYNEELYYPLADTAQKWIARNGEKIIRTITVFQYENGENSHTEDTTNKTIEFKIVTGIGEQQTTTITRTEHYDYGSYVITDGSSRVVMPTTYMTLTAKGITVRDNQEYPIYFTDEVNNGNHIFNVYYESTFNIEYYAYPQTITKDDIEDTYEFEVPENTHCAIPYYIAFNLVLEDNPSLATSLKNEWNKHMAVFDNRPFSKTVRLSNNYRRNRRF